MGHPSQDTLPNIIFLVFQSKIHVFFHFEIQIKEQTLVIRGDLHQIRIENAILIHKQLKIKLEFFHIFH